MKKYLPIISIIILGLFLRLYHNTSISLWHDEAFSALLIKYPWSEMMYRIGLDVHPPAYYILLRVWNYIFSDSLLSLRLFSVLFGVSAIWAMWLLVRVIFKSQSLAIISALLLAINPFQIQYATEARMYTMGVFFTLLASYFTVQVLQHWHKLEEISLSGIPYQPEVKKLRVKMFWHWLGMVGSLVIMLYTHYYLMFSVIAIGLFFAVYLFSHRLSSVWKKCWLLVITALSIGLAFLPWLNIFVYQFKQVGSGYWIPPMDKWSIPTTLYSLLLGFSYDIHTPQVKILLTIFTLAFGIVVYKFLTQTINFYKWLILLVALAPFAGSVLFLVLAKAKGSDSSVFLVRYFVFTSPFLTIILTVWLTQIKRKVLAKLCIVIYASLCLMAFYRYWDNVHIETRPGMAKAVKYIQANWQTKDKLYSANSGMFFNLKYYLNQTFSTTAPIPNLLLYTNGVRSIQGLPHYAGTAILENKDIIFDLNSNTQPGDVIWLVWTNGFWSSKPTIPNNWLQLNEQAFPEVRPHLGTSVFVTEYRVN